MTRPKPIDDDALDDARVRDAEIAKVLEDDERSSPPEDDDAEEEDGEADGEEGAQDR